jgi:peptidyl-prolyl cis-trans isomerase C
MFPMIENFKSTAVALLTGAFLLQTGLAQTTNKAKFSEADLFPDKVLARGKGFEVKTSEFEDAFIAYKGSLAARGVTLPEEKRDKVESDLLQQLILEKILNNMATDEDRTKGKEEAEKTLARLRQEIPEETYRQRLRTAGVTEQGFRDRFISEGVRRAVLEREVKAKVNITDEEVKKYYEENASKFDIPEQVRASHILIATRSKSGPLPEAEKQKKLEAIKKLRERIVGGEDFAKLAKEFSEDPGSKDRGGEYTFARGEMAASFERVAFGLKPDEISDVVETQFGFHVIKLHEKTPARKQPLSEVSEKIKTMLTAKEFEKRLPDYFEKIKKDAGVEILADKK